MSEQKGTNVKFIDLWRNHPHVNREGSVLDEKTYENQCAINLGVALARSGVGMESFKGALSWQKDKPKYPIRAQELASWLERAPKGIPFGPVKFTGDQIRDPKTKETVFDRLPIKGGTEILFFQNYWGVGLQGDHIDLWDGSRLTEISSWLRIHAQLVIPGMWSDLLKSNSIWYWTIP